MAAVYLLPEIDILRQINALCAVGMRPPFIESLFPSVSKRQIAETWTHYNGMRPPRGPLAMSAKASINSPLRRWHASYLLIVYERLIKAGIGDIDAALGAYRDYSDTFEQKDLLNFDRAWIIMRRLGCRTEDGITIVTCSHCGSRYAHFVEELVDDRNCVVHAYDANSKRIVRNTRGRKGEASDESTLPYTPRGRVREYKPATTAAC